MFYELPGISRKARVTVPLAIERRLAAPTR
jgi:hypothetical protein